ncbi:hypothetical protein Tco_0388683, partial [Tanacetum coccineum]
FVKKPYVNKFWRVKQVKQVWQATGKLFTNVGYQWKPTGRKFTLGEQCPLTRFTKSKVVPVKQPENVNKMADENVPAPTPTRFDDQILPFAAWVPIGKSNHVLDLQKRQKNPIFQIALDENWFTLDANLLREALEITPINQAHPFMSPPSGDAIMDFVNELGYPPTKKGRKDKPYIIPYCRFTKLIICHLRRIHNIHQRSASPFHLAEEDIRLGNLKFVSKGEVDEVFGMPIPNELISNNIKNAPYYNAYLEMVAKHDQKVAAEKEGKKKMQLVDEPDEEPAHSEHETEPEHQGEGEEFDMESDIQMSLESCQAQDILRVTAAQKASTQFIFQRRTPATEEASTRPSTTPQDDTSANIVHDSPSLADPETGARSDKINSGDPGETYKSRPPAEHVLMDEDQAGPDPGIRRVALAGPDPEPTHDKFMATLYPKVQESLKFPADDHVILEDPLSLTGTLYSMKNLEDAYAIGD